MELARVIHLAMEIWGIIFVALTFFCEWMGRKTDSFRGKKIRMILIMAVGLLLADVLSWAFRGVPTTLGVVMTRVNNFCTFFLQVVIPSLYLDALSYHCKDAPWKKHVRIICNTIMAIGAVLLVVNLFFPFLYDFDETNHYFRLPLNFVWYIPAALYIPTGIYVAVKSSKEWNVSLLTEAIVVYVSIVGTTIMQVFLYGISYTVLAFTVNALLMAFLHLADKSNELLRRENELQEMRMLQLRAQMQPHFMFNSLTTIRSLIRRDPDEAYLAISDFSRYLRGSVTALSDVKNWSIAQEMQMVEGYLSLEKRRFGDNLLYTIEMTDTEFSVPNLAVQTLVENAVRHGICAMAGGSGNLLVRTERRGLDHAVIIKDDGVGFDPSAPLPDDGRVHTGLTNTRKRVEENGEMIIDSAPGKGTTITLIIH